MNTSYTLLIKICIILLINTCAIQLNGQKSRQIYDLTIEELQSINVIPDSSAGNYSPSYEISIKDLMELEIVKELKVDNYLDVSYDIPMEELMHVELDVRRDTGIEPTYEMSLKGLSSLEIKEDVSVIEKISLSYDISLDGIMKITIKEVKAPK